METPGSVAPSPRKALVLSGGGAKGAYEAGLVATLEREFNERFDIICGTSIGAINAAFLAQEDLDALTQLWRTIGQQRIVSLFPRLDKIRGMYEHFATAAHATGLRSILPWGRAMVDAIRTIVAIHPVTWLGSMTGAIDPSHTSALLAGKLDLNTVKRVLITTATDLTTQTADVFYHFPPEYAALTEQFLSGFDGEEQFAYPFHAENFAETIRASGAIPAAFSPVTLEIASPGMRQYVDGGVVNNTPIGLAIDAGADEVTIIYLDPVATKSNAPPVLTSLPEILLGCFSIMQQRLLELDYDTALSMNKQSSHDGGSGRRKVRLRRFRPATTLPVGVIDFGEQAAIDASYAMGQNDARNASQRTHFEE